MNDQPRRWIDERKGADNEVFMNLPYFVKKRNQAKLEENYEVVLSP